MSWDAASENYGFTATISGRTPLQLCEDVQDFLLMLSSYLPHGYITDKLLKKSRSFESAFAIIEEHYGLTPSQETFCDFSSMVRLPDEPYRQYYDRLVAFMTKHLMPEGTQEVDGISVKEGGETLSISLLNLIALQWISRIHSDLLGIIRTEYAKELRENVPISALVPRIALAVDALLKKYDKVPSVAKIDEVQGQ